MNLTSVGFAYGRLDLWVCCLIVFYFYTEGRMAPACLGFPISLQFVCLNKQINNVPKTSETHTSPPQINILSYSLVILECLQWSESIVVYQFLEYHHYHFKWIWINSDAKYCQNFFSLQYLWIYMTELISYTCRATNTFALRGRKQCRITGVYCFRTKKQPHTATNVEMTKGHCYISP